MIERDNIEEKIEFLRDTFLKAEKEYLKELMKNPKNMNFIIMLSKFDSKKVALEAWKRIEMIENGEVNEEDLEQVEAEITLLLAALIEYKRKKERKRDFDMEI